MKFTKVLAAMACLTAAACTTPTPMPGNGRQMSTYDTDTEYTVEYVADGFTLTVNHRYGGFTVRTGTAQATCRAMLASVANNLAERRQRRIEPIDPQRIRLATSRNWYGSMATCSATAPVVWQR
ncbi:MULTISPECIES: hypothetical protein [Cupriavidus]